MHPALIRSRGFSPLLQIRLQHKVGDGASGFAAFEDHVAVVAVAFELGDDPVKSVVVCIEIGVVHLVGVAQDETFHMFSHAGQQCACLVPGDVLCLVDDDDGVLDVHPADEVQADDLDLFRVQFRFGGLGVYEQRICRTLSMQFHDQVR